ncbi:MAG: hypothetical protein RMJ43_15105 [Chloroherpetonaceae bacterium]|nr:hypothetical protein [Chthonomonadaceae bacterium]MDW8209161.1 hypothetical protein [Chloroherpetonaceae bacterium]
MTPPAARSARSWPRAIVIVLLIWMLTVTMLITVAVWQRPVLRAILLMSWGLILLWILLGGSLMFHFRNAFCARMQRLPVPPGIGFVVLATLLACAEEAVTTLMTNLAPLFGVAIGQAYITASTNYLDVIALHSVVAFIPQFAVWAGLLTRYHFRPFAVFLLYGLTGLCNEILFGGPQQALNFALWIFVYGLMVYIPAYCFTTPYPRREVPRWLYPAAIFLPIPSSALSFFLLRWLAPNHPSIHFPPITG